jgi:2-oxoglutarate/2-oxoacid ferredoxin oxidoreductase subunit alpha
MSNLNNRLVVKLAGAAGQGIKTAGVIIAKSFKRAGYKTFSYTEYPSLIRGGHNVYQIEIYDTPMSSVSQETDILLALDQPSITLHWQEIPEGGAIIYDGNTINLTEEQITAIADKKITLYPIKLLELAQQQGGNALMKNTVALGALWKVTGLDLEVIKPVLAETYNKTKEMVDLNLKCLTAGAEAVVLGENKYTTNLSPKDEFKNDIIITGNEAIALGAIAGGVRLYSSYPMTPASSILSTLAEEGPKYGMIVKQAEDEITAANMVIGANHGGTRAMCGTSGGGFDLMTEALSLAGMTEVPFTCVIGQRPGPATGAPTWTAQGDLNLALHAGHGDFPRIVLAPGDAEEAFYLTTEALNLAEKYQTPVLILSDKYLAENNYSVPKFDMKKVTIDRGKLLQPSEFAANQDKLRYELTEDGVSTRWFPGDNVNTFLANSDEHTTKGYSTEESKEMADMMAKRSRKETTIKQALPDPVIYGDPATADLVVISWGSNKPTILDAMTALKTKGIKIAFMQVTYIWPLKEETIKTFLSQSKKRAILEGNISGQLHKLIWMYTGIEIEHKLFKYDGRPIFFEEAVAFLSDVAAK